MNVRCDVYSRIGRCCTHALRDAIDLSRPTNALVQMRCSGGSDRERIRLGLYVDFPGFKGNVVLGEAAFRAAGHHDVADLAAVGGSIWSHCIFERAAGEAACKIADAAIFLSLAEDGDGRARADGTGADRCFEPRDIVGCFRRNPVHVSPSSHGNCLTSAAEFETAPKTPPCILIILIAARWLPRSVAPQQSSSMTHS